MFKIGDKIRRTGDTGEGVIRGNVYWITWIGPNMFSDGQSVELQGVIGRYDADRFVIVSKTKSDPPKNELEWLDRIQQNFKE